MSPQTWKRKKCLRTKSKNGGWTNLVNHLRTCIGDDYERVYEAARTDQKNGINGFVLRLVNNEREMFDWIDIVVMRSLPLAFVECQYPPNCEGKASVCEDNTSAYSLP